LPDYGNTVKQICFDSLDKIHADLKIRLHYDDIKIREFFNEIVIAYIEKNEHIMSFVGELKDKKQISKKKRKKISRSNTKAEEVKSSFGLNDSEIENIFDILEKEWGV
jgi:Zn-dependent metalloprotease